METESKPQRELVVYYQGCHCFRFLMADEKMEREFKAMLDKAMDATVGERPIATWIVIGDTRFVVGHLTAGYQFRDVTESPNEIQSRFLKEALKQMDPDRDEPWKRGEGGDL